MYPTNSQAEILEALPGRKWKNIQLQANRMGLIRHGFGGRKGESRYGDQFVYCSKCQRFKKRVYLINNRCPICKSRVRDPGASKRRR